MSNTDHVKTVRILDRVTIICPLPHDNRPYEYSKLFMVCFNKLLYNCSRIINAGNFLYLVVIYCKIKGGGKEAKTIVFG